MPGYILNEANPQSPRLARGDTFCAFGRVIDFLELGLSNTRSVDFWLSPGPFRVEREQQLSVNWDDDLFVALLRHSFHFLYT